MTATTEEEKENDIVRFETGTYKQLREEFRYYWEEGRIAAEKAGKVVNEMVSLLHKEYPEWSISKIAKKIWIDNEDLDGFSKNTIYRNLNDDNRTLLDESKQNRNNVIEHSVPTWEHKDIEDSSITSGSIDSNDFTDNPNVVYHPTLPITQEEENIEPTEEIQSFSEDSSEVRQLKYQLEISNKTIQELEKRLQQIFIQKTGGGTLEDKFTFKCDFEITNEMLRQIKNNRGIMPLIATAYPDKKTGYVRFDNARLKESIKKKIIVKQ